MTKQVLIRPIPLSPNSDFKSSLSDISKILEYLASFDIDGNRAYLVGPEDEILLCNHVDDLASGQEGNFAFPYAGRVPRMNNSQKWHLASGVAGKSFRHARSCHQDSMSLGNGEARWIFARPELRDKPNLLVITR